MRDHCRYGNHVQRLLIFNLRLPLNRCFPVCLQIFVGVAEVLVTKETIVG